MDCPQVMTGGEGTGRIGLDHDHVYRRIAKEGPKLRLQSLQGIEREGIPVRRASQGYCANPVSDPAPERKDGGTVSCYTVLSMRLGQWLGKLKDAHGCAQ